ncbi:hypothetical protein F2Q69_00057682, partial [Brassica cretica]
PSSPHPHHNHYILHLACIRSRQTHIQNHRRNDLRRKFRRLEPSFPRNKRRDTRSSSHFNPLPPQNAGRRNQRNVTARSCLPHRPTAAPLLQHKPHGASLSHPNASLWKLHPCNQQLSFGFYTRWRSCLGARFVRLSFHCYTSHRFSLQLLSLRWRLSVLIKLPFIRFSILCVLSIFSILKLVKKKFYMEYVLRNIWVHVEISLYNSSIVSTSQVTQLNPFAGP